jgi:hypothetical protein
MLDEEELDINNGKILVKPTEPNKDLTLKHK